MAEEATQDVVLVHSSPSESPTVPSTEQPEDDDAHMDDTDGASSSSTEAGDCLSNHPVSPVTRPAQEDMRAAGDDARSAMPPQDVNLPSDSPGSHFSESPIKRRPGPFGSYWASTTKEVTQITCLNIQATARQRSRTCATAGHAK